MDPLVYYRNTGALEGATNTACFSIMARSIEDALKHQNASEFECYYWRRRIQRAAIRHATDEWVKKTW